MEVTNGYKAMNMDMTCMGFQFEVGKTYRVDNDKPLIPCTDSGFHFCKKTEDVFKYYNWFDCRVFEIEAYGEVVDEINKSIAKEIKIIKELDINKFSPKTKDGILFKDFLNKTEEECWELINNKDTDWKTAVAIIKTFSNTSERIYNFFKDDKVHYIREALVKNSSDINRIYNDFKDDGDPDVLLALINKLTDVDLIFETFKDNAYSDVRITVIKKLENKKLIFETFKDDDSPTVQAEVIKKLEDLELLYHTFKDSEYWYVKHSLINKLSDENLIFNTFKSDPSHLVRIAVIENVSDIDLLIKTYKNDSNTLVQRALKEKIELAKNC